MPAPSAAAATSRAIPRPPAPTGALARLHAEIRRCAACPLARTRRHACPGEGPERAAIMIVGEAPGFEENRQGRPFVGPAGQLLTDLLAEAGIDRSSVYLSNVAKCLPPKTGGSAEPPREAVEACRTFLAQELDLVGPSIVIAAGSTALRALVDPRLSITQARGRAFFKDGRWLYPIYHPSYVLRSSGDPRVAAEMRDDLAALRHLRGLHAATLRRPWPLADVVRHVFCSRAAPHAPTARSPAHTWHVVDHFALPKTSGATVTWDVRGLRPMFQTPSAIQELLRRWTGQPVRLDRVSERHGASATILAPEQTALAPHGQGAPAARSGAGG
jgi:uracil-DNA glycosylase family 4